MIIYPSTLVNSISVVYRVFHYIVIGISSNLAKRYDLVIRDCSIEYSVYVVVFIGGKEYKGERWNNNSAWRTDWSSEFSL